MIVFNSNKLAACILLVTLMGLASCAHTPSKPIPPAIVYENTNLFGAPQNVASEDSLFSLSDHQKQEFLAFFNAPNNSDVEPYSRVYEFLASRTQNFNYKTDTYIADESLSLQAGNCLSLALLTTALAQVADIKIRYQLVDSTPVFEKTDDLIIKGVHVRSKLFGKRDENQLFTSDTGIIIDYFPSGDKRFLGNLSRQEFISRYYLNIAAEHIEVKDYVSAYWHTRKALEYAPDDQANINTMAVIFKRMGDVSKAEEIYKYGIEISNEKLTLLKNYHLLLLSQARDKEARAVDKKISRIKDPSPYNWIRIGDSALATGDYFEAQRYYKKAIELAPYLQYAYLGLAKTYHAQGRLKPAKEMLLLAMENNYNGSNQAMYEAKLAMLTEGMSRAQPR